MSRIMGLQEVKHMEINAERVIELVKSVRPLFMDHERASRITVKGAADFVTQVDFLVQERMRSGLFDILPQKNQCPCYLFPPP